jgi:hypothetical protein
MGPRLARDAGDVATVQLYATGSEVAPPVLFLNSQNTLTLEFDVLKAQGRPLTVHFYHANREWRLDLSPAEYLGTYHRDNILEYRPAQATETRYVHYAYRFPNSAIQFLVSGNYIIRVAEQGDEEAVLFERTFFVAEEAVPVDLLLDDVFVSQSTFPAVQPTARFTPPAEAQGNVFDFSVCFARDGRFAEVRCSENPSLMNQPALEFYLQPRSSFVPAGSDYVLDLVVLQPGGQIERLDVTSSPFQVQLAPDYVRFGADDLAPRLYGQVAVASVVRDTGEPALQAEYIETEFSLVTEGDRPLAGDVYVVGAFTGWQRTEQARMTWDAEARRYRVVLLVKQGRYEYRYTSPNAGALAALSQSMPRRGDRYTALVYYRDIRVQTDRLVGVGTRSEY